MLKLFRPSTPMYFHCYHVIMCFTLNDSIGANSLSLEIPTKRQKISSSQEKRLLVIKKTMCLLKKNN